MDVKSGRFMYQSGRAGDEAKKRKSSAKAGEFTSPGEVLGISSDGDDRRIFLGLKFSIPRFFWV